MKIIKLEDILAQTKTPEDDKNEQKVEDDSDDSSEESDLDIKNKKATSVPCGRPKSGRVWKEKRKRFSSIVKTPGLRLSKEKKDLLRQELKNVKEHARALMEERKKEKEERRLRRQENLKRQEENKRKSEIVQVIKNTAKIKRMKKKHLRQIEKRDTTVVRK
ncbi:coiled-coil domain-containing protein 86 [Periplaneta americana]|uniref:coiled-coil domain-containing protein 86 n=1 Tax=Periplaneta americana TaxID=6978 RepID=UPI0037E71D97